MIINGTIMASTGTEGDAPGRFDFPNGIQLSKDGELFVCDTRNHRIQVFDKDLNLIRILGKKGNGKGYFTSPDDLSFDDRGNIYVVECGNCRVQVLTPQGQHIIRNIGGPGTHQGQFANPVSPAIHRGLLYVTDCLKNKGVSVFKLTGEFVVSFGEGILQKPECITIDDNGFVYVS